MASDVSGPDSSEGSAQVDFPEYLDESMESWDAVADWWDDRIGDGNATQDYLVEPNQERLLELETGQRVLDVGCGAGRFTRRMADAGVQVVALDHSKVFIERARKRSQAYHSRIDFRVMNAADGEALSRLGVECFDAAVCTMALMDMAVITPLAESLPRLLKPGGRFVFSVTHPVFNTDGTRMIAEREYGPRGVSVRFAASVADYLKPRAYLGVGIEGQSRQHRYFHRPIGMLLDVFLRQSLVLDALIEPQYPMVAHSEAKHPLSSVHFRHFPQIFVARLRKSD